MLILLSFHISYIFFYYNKTMSKKLAYFKEIDNIIIEPGNQKTERQNGV